MFFLYKCFVFSSPTNCFMCIYCELRNAMVMFNKNIFFSISSIYLTAVWFVLIGAGSEMNGHCFLSSLSSMAFCDTETDSVKSWMQNWVGVPATSEA